jgi:hypothetical protein
MPLFLKNVLLNDYTPTPNGVRSPRKKQTLRPHANGKNSFSRDDVFYGSITEHEILKSQKGVLGAMETLIVHDG